MRAMVELVQRARRSIHRRRQSRLANPGLAGSNTTWPWPVLAFDPASKKEFEFLFVLKLEQIAKEFSGAYSDDHLVRLSDALQARCEVM